MNRYIKRLPSVIATVLISAFALTIGWIGGQHNPLPEKELQTANSIWDIGLSNRETTLVYWTDDGEVYHLSRNCSALKHSLDIHSGTIAESGKERVCEICGK